MHIGFAQINTTVGDIRANRDRIFSAYEEAVSSGADLVLTPELALTGYPPQDMVFKSGFVPALAKFERVGRFSCELVGSGIFENALVARGVDGVERQIARQFVNNCSIVASAAATAVCNLVVR